MFPSKPAQIIIHIAGWILFFSLVVGFIASNPEMRFGDILLSSAPYLLFLFVYVFVFYFNGEVLLPRLYLQKKYFYYFLAILAIFLAVYFLQPFDRIISQQMHPPGGPGDRMPPPPRHLERLPPRRSNKLDIVSIVLFIMVWSLSTALQIIKQWRRTEQRAVRAEADKAHAELSFLKAQINPHFLFNTLNNIYSQAISKSEHTAESVMKLSNIMRYLTDDAGRDYVPLSDELGCIKDYIDLQRMRVSNKVKLTYDFTDNPDEKRIPPLVLMAFIENVFKYGVSSHEETSITIRLTTNENSITFFCQNKITGIAIKEGRTGIGIANTRQRLEFLYPGKHLLNIFNDGRIYTVELILND